ncbi:MAG TPA: hypothetical protein VJA19_16520 [Pseudomonas sp.]|nr:hypothetical protein [Pseudomonas sp.]
MQSTVLNLCLSALVLIGSVVPVQAQPSAPAGSPGTATPTPYPSSPMPRALPSPAYQPPLLKTVEPPPPRDQPIPLLEQQLRRNSQGLGRVPENRPAPPLERRE